MKPISEKIRPPGSIAYMERYQLSVFVEAVHQT